MVVTKKHTIRLHQLAHLLQASYVGALQHYNCFIENSLLAKYAEKYVLEVLESCQPSSGFPIHVLILLSTGFFFKF